MINNNKIFSCESFTIEEKLKRLAERQYNPETGTTGDPDLDKYLDNEKSEEGLTEFMNQHGKKVYSKNELDEQIEKIKTKYGDRLVKTNSEWKKLGGFDGLNFMSLCKSIGPSSSSYFEYNGIFIYRTNAHGTFNWRNYFCYIKTGEKYDKKNKNRKPTMKLISIACVMLSKK